MHNLKINIESLGTVSRYIVDELVDNGFARLNSNYLEVDIDTIYNLVQEERDLIGLPKFLDCDLSISTSGVINTDSLTFEPLFCMPDGSVLTLKSVHFPYIEVNGSKYLLKEEHKCALSFIETYNSSSNKRLDAYSCINNLKGIEDLVLSKTLNDNEFKIIEKVEIAPEVIDDEFVRITPKLNEDFDEGFMSKFDKLNSRLSADLRSSFTLNDEGKRKKIILSSRLVEEFDKIKNNRISPWTRDVFIEELHRDPTLGFDPEKVDLGNFSERVEEIGVYIPKVKVVASDFNNNWIPALEVKMASGEMVRLNIQDESDLDGLLSVIRDSETLGKSHINYKGYLITLKHAKELFDSCEKQLAEENPISINGRVIPIVKEDDDLVESDIDLLSDGTFQFVNPPGLKDGVSLFDHQKTGVAWMQTIFKDKNGRGALLADDMGLGKTIQILSFVHWHKSFQEEVGTNLPYLIVAPVSLIENWENEYYKFFYPEGNIIQFYGVSRNTDLLINATKDDVIITNYESLVANGVEFASINWSIIALDEAQKIKNPNTYISHVVKSLKSEFNIALTGTPIENKLLDIWNILDFVEPGFLGGRKQFLSTYSVKFDKDPELAMVKSAELRTKIGFRMLRRLKSEVAKDLPNKFLLPHEWDGFGFHECAFELSDLQDKYYQDVKRDYINSIELRLERPNVAMLKAIDSWKRICDHPLIADKLWAPIESTNTIELIQQSAKLRKTVEIIHTIRSKGEKVLVFSDIKLTQRMLKKVFIAEFGVSAKVINGDTAITTTYNNDSRQKIVDEFNKSEGFNILILSPVAAGFGLNITGANNVIHYTRHWNPAKENQASDRAYRIGQKKDVSIYHPMSLSKNYQTFDAKLDLLLRRKRMLAENSLIPTGMVKVVELI